MPGRSSAADHWLRAMSEERHSGRQGRPGFEGDAPWHEPVAAGSPEPRPIRPAPIVEPEPPGGAHSGRIGWLESRRQRLRYWWRGASPNLRGSVFMFAALLVYAVSRIEGDEFKSSVFSWVFWLSILVAMIVPTVGPPHASVPMLAVLMLCSSAELLRYGWWEKIKGVIGLALAGFALSGVVPSAFPHFMMTGRIL